MLVATPVTTDVRILREAGALVEAGHAVHVVGKDVPADAHLPDGFTASSASGGGGLRGSATGPVDLSRAHLRAARWLLMPEHRRLSYRRWASGAAAAASGLDYDVVHAHDFTALALGSRLARRRAVPLVYDAHELWSERQRSGRPTPFERRQERRTEGILGGRADAVLTVGEALAERLRISYGWEHVSVVRNTFPLPPEAADAEVPRAPAGVVYAGRLAPGRDLATVAAASRRMSLPVQLVGPSDPAWSAGFDPGRCVVVPAVEVADVEAVLRSAGLALVTLEPGCGNHQIALPNKLFHAVRAGVPVVASDVGELARTVQAHGIGVLYRPGDAESLIRAVEEARRRHTELVAAVRRAREELSWDRDRVQLLKVYAGLAR